VKAAPELVERQVFVCPNCGGSTFGSSDPSAAAPGSAFTPTLGAALPVPTASLTARGPSPVTLVRMCHDEHGIGCRFEWSQADDARYFRGTGQFFPRTVQGTVGPSGARLERAKVAFDTHARAVWGEKAAAFDGKPDWVKEQWAQIADVAIGRGGKTEAARLAAQKWIELEGRARLGQSWEAMGFDGQGVWLEVVGAVRALASSQA